MTEMLLAAGASGPPPGFYLALVPIIVLAIVFDVYCLRDLIRAKSVRSLPKFVWAIIILASAPWGGLIYLLAGRDPHQGSALPR
jgi:ABC-2 type transport system ATP-binding protein